MKAIHYRISERALFFSMRLKNRRSEVEEEKEEKKTVKRIYLLIALSKRIDIDIIND